jgi:inorganic pyrophosphatase
MQDINNYIGKTVQITIDRQLGSKHPEFDWIYPINYGFVESTVSGDGKELDAYILGVDVPLTSFKGTCIAVAVRKDDDDPKLIIVPEGVSMSDEEIMKAINFQEKWFDSYLER